MKLLLTLTTALLIFTSCASDPEPALTLEDTQWQAPDSIKDFIYGGTNYQHYDFTSSTAVSYYRTHNGSVSDLAAATYSITDDLVTVTLDDKEYTYTHTGTLLVSHTQRDLFTDEVIIYIKQ